jgi:hypothetical protein
MLYQLSYSCVIAAGEPVFKEARRVRQAASAVLDPPGPEGAEAPRRLGSGSSAAVGPGRASHLADSPCPVYSFVIFSPWSRIPLVAFRVSKMRFDFATRCA